ncbi:MAG: hypothetical protein ACM35G_01610, partial [Planctomycetaceae bacterium]
MKTTPLDRYPYYASTDTWMLEGSHGEPFSPVSSHQEAKVRSRKILTNCLALHALIALFPIPRAAANPLMTQPLI